MLAEKNAIDFSALKAHIALAATPSQSSQPSFNTLFTQTTFPRAQKSVLLETIAGKQHAQKDINSALVLPLLNSNFWSI
jgi:hypothetical protein